MHRLLHLIRIIGPPKAKIINHFMLANPMILWHLIGPPFAEIRVKTKLIVVYVTADLSPPWVQCPANQVTTVPSGQFSTSYTYPPATASDNNGQNVGILYSTPSGSSFNRGTTEVTVTATDTFGNEALCIFAVTVNGKGFIFFIFYFIFFWSHDLLNRALHIRNTLLTSGFTEAGHINKIADWFGH